MDGPVGRQEQDDAELECFADNQMPAPCRRLFAQLLSLRRWCWGGGDPDETPLSSRVTTIEKQLTCMDGKIKTINARSQKILLVLLVTALELATGIVLLLVQMASKGP